MRGGDGTLENAVSPSKNSLATATFRLYKSDKFEWIFSGKAKRYLWKMFTSLPESSVVPQLWNKPWWTSSNFCQITSYPKLQEEHFKKENTDFNDGNGYFEQLRTGNIRTSRNQTSQQETPNNLGYKNCWAHNAEVIAAVPWAFQCSHIHTTLLSRTLLVFCSFQDFAYFSPLFIITHLNLYHIQGLPGRWRCWALGTSLGYLSCPIQWTLPLQSEQPRWRKRSSDKKPNQNNTSIISTTEKPDDLCRHIWADFSHARVEQ